MQCTILNIRLEVQQSGPQVLPPVMNVVSKEKYIDKNCKPIAKKMHAIKEEKNTGNKRISLDKL